jgi:anti-anti-sigma factor
MGARNDAMNPPRFTLATTVTGDAAAGLTVSGESDIATVGRFETVLHGIPTNPGRTRVVLDFAPLAVVDVNGVSALHIARHTAKRRGIARTVTTCRDIVRRTLDITGPYRHLTRNRAATRPASPEHPTVNPHRLAGGELRSQWRCLVRTTIDDHGFGERFPRGGAAGLTIPPLAGWELTEPRLEHGRWR